MVKNTAMSERLRSLRLARRTVTRHEAAKGIGVPYATYCNWEQAKCLPAIDQLPNIACYFGLTVDELLQADTETVVTRLSALISSLSDEDRATVERIVDALAKSKG